MKIRINGKTIETENIYSIGKIKKGDFDNKIYFSICIEYKNDTYDTLYFDTPIYSGVIHTEVFSKKGKSKSYWFKDTNFIEELPEYKEVYAIALKCKSDLEIIWDMKGQMYPLREFNSYKL